MEEMTHKELALEFKKEELRTLKKSKQEMKKRINKDFYDPSSYFAGKAAAFAEAWVLVVFGTKDTLQSPIKDTAGNEKWSNIVSLMVKEMS